jgi:hypothetical protein
MAQCFDRDGGITRAIERFIDYAEGAGADAPFHLKAGAADEIAAQHLGSTCE